LRSDSTAAGSNGTAQWTERERVAQTKTQTALYTGAAANSPNYPSLSQFILGGTEAGYNSLLDCAKETGSTAAFTISGTPLTGKTFRMTAYGLANTIGGSRSINFRIRSGGVDYFTAGYTFSGSTTGTSIWTLQVNMVYCGSSNVAGSLHSFATCAMIRDLTAVSPITTLLNAIGTSGSSPLVTFVNGTGYLFELQAQLGGTVNVGDTIECRSCMWEVLN
jgi:hypothetical protein